MTIDGMLESKEEKIRRGKGRKKVEGGRMKEYEIKYLI